MTTTLICGPYKIHNYKHIYKSYEPLGRFGPLSAPIKGHLSIFWNFQFFNFFWIFGNFLNFYGFLKVLQMFLDFSKILKRKIDKQKYEKKEIKR